MSRPIPVCYKCGAQVCPPAMWRLPGRVIIMRDRATGRALCWGCGTDLENLGQFERAIIWRDDLPTEPSWRDQ